MLAVAHCCSLLLTVAHCCSLLLTVAHCCSLLLTVPGIYLFKRVSRKTLSRQQSESHNQRPCAFGIVWDATMREIVDAATFRKRLQVHNETDIEDVKIEDRPSYFFCPAFKIKHLRTPFSFFHFSPRPLGFWAFFVFWFRSLSHSKGQKWYPW